MNYVDSSCNDRLESYVRLPAYPYLHTLPTSLPPFTLTSPSTCLITKPKQTPHSNQRAFNEPQE